MSRKFGERKLFSVITFEKNHKKSIYIEKVNIGNGLYFFKINLKKGAKRKMDFLKNCLDKNTLTAVISSNGFPLPDFIIPYNSYTFRVNIFINSFLQFLKHASFADKTIAFYDEKGEFCELENRFCDKFKEVFIITKHTEKYSFLIEESYKNYGHFPIIKNTFSGEYYDFFVDFSTNKFLINLKNECYDFLEFDQQKILLPHFLKSAVPEGVNEIDFCAAAYEYFSLKIPDNIYFSR